MDDEVLNRIIAQSVTVSGDWQRLRAVAQIAAILGPIRARTLVQEDRIAAMEARLATLDQQRRSQPLRSPGMLHDLLQHSVKSHPSAGVAAAVMRAVVVPVVALMVAAGREEHPMTTVDLITGLFCRVDGRLHFSGLRANC